MEREILLCYRGHYQAQVRALAEKVRGRGLRVTYDREILSGPSPQAGTDVEWVNLGVTENQVDTSWRGPLKAAVESSFLVVFLIDPHDQSENIVNEISWVARAGGHSFFVMDVPSEGISVEAEGIFLSSLHIVYAMATERWEVPDLEYIVFCHSDPDDLDARLDVAANRVEDYFRRTRDRPLPTIRMDNDLTVADLEQHPVTRARRLLRTIQQQMYDRFGLVPPTTGGDAHQEALEAAYAYEEQATVEGEFIRPAGSPFRYPRMSELERFRRTNQIIDRTRPGPCEFGVTYALLARQAATIELTIQATGKDDRPFDPPVLLGTLPFTAVDDVVTVGTDGTFGLVLVDQAFVDFVYQIQKVSVCAWTLRSPPGQSPSSFTNTEDEVRATIQERPDLVDGLHRCTRRYVIEGTPDSSLPGPPRPEYQLPLTVLTNDADRFIVGRGYAQLALLDPTLRERLGVEPPAVDRQAATLQADALTARLVLLSAAVLDRVDPAVALPGLGMPIVCTDLVHQAVEALGGPSVAERRPTAEERLAVVEEEFIRLLTANGETREQAVERLAPARRSWLVPKLLWERAGPRLAQERDAERPSWIWR